MSRIITLPTFSDTRGNLTVLEKILPFTIKRVYWIYGVKPQEERGKHRHFVTSQAFVCLNGSVTLHIDHLNEKYDFVLDSPKQCIILLPEEWHVLKDFSQDAVVLVLASHDYDSNDYSSEPL